MIAKRKLADKESDHSQRPPRGTSVHFTNDGREGRKIIGVVIKGYHRFLDVFKYNNPSPNTHFYSKGLNQSIGKIELEGETLAEAYMAFFSRITFFTISPFLPGSPQSQQFRRKKSFKSREGLASWAKFLS